MRKFGKPREEKPLRQVFLSLRRRLVLEWLEDRNLLSGRSLKGEALSVLWTPSGGAGAVDPVSGLASDSRFALIADETPSHGNTSADEVIQVLAETPSFAVADSVPRPVSAEREGTLEAQPAPFLPTPGIEAREAGGSISTPVVIHPAVALRQDSPELDPPADARSRPEPIPAPPPVPPRSERPAASVPPVTRPNPPPPPPPASVGSSLDLPAGEPRQQPPKYSLPPLGDAPPIGAILPKTVSEWIVTVRVPQDYLPTAPLVESAEPLPSLNEGSPKRMASLAWNTIAAPSWNTPAVGMVERQAHENIAETAVAGRYLAAPAWLEHAPSSGQRLDSEPAPRTRTEEPKATVAFSVAVLDRSWELRQSPHDSYSANLTDALPESATSVRAVAENQVSQVRALSRSAINWLAAVGAGEAGWSVVSEAVEELARLAPVPEGVSVAPPVESGMPFLAAGPEVWEALPSGTEAALVQSTGPGGRAPAATPLREEDQSAWGLLFAPALFAFGIPTRCPATILLIEHDEPTRDALHMLLVEEGYLVLVAGTAHDALGALRAPLAPIDLVLLDAHLPDISSMMLYARMQQLYPELPVVICSRGEIDPAELAGIRESGIPYYLRKPVAQEKLLATVQAVLS